jgi:hypothetical protein
MYCREAPSVVTCSASNRAWTPKTLPVRRWQARQWQIETRTGSPSTVSRSCSQLHAACRVLMIVIVDSSAQASFRNAGAVHSPCVRMRLPATGLMGGVVARPRLFARIAPPANDLHHRSQEGEVAWCDERLITASPAGTGWGSSPPPSAHPIPSGGRKDESGDGPCGIIRVGYQPFAT